MTVRIDVARLKMQLASVRKKGVATGIASDVAAGRHGASTGLRALREARARGAVGNTQARRARANIVFGELRRKKAALAAKPPSAKPASAKAPSVKPASGPAAGAGGKANPGAATKEKRRQAAIKAARARWAGHIKEQHGIDRLNRASVEAELRARGVHLSQGQPGQTALGGRIFRDAAENLARARALKQVGQQQAAADAVPPKPATPVDARGDMTRMFDQFVARPLGDRVQRNRILDAEAERHGYDKEKWAAMGNLNRNLVREVQRKQRHAHAAADAIQRQKAQASQKRKDDAKRQQDLANERAVNAPAPDGHTGKGALRDGPESDERREGLRTAAVQGTEINGKAGINPSYVATLTNSHPPPPTVRAMYKPEAGERTLGVRGEVRNDAFTLAGREAISSRVNDAFGLDVVPSTVYRDGPKGTGSMQQFAEGAQTFSAHGQQFPANIKIDKMYKLVVFDVLAGHLDRHAANWMITPDGSPVAIDNGYAWGGQAAGGAYLHYKQSELTSMGMGSFRSPMQKWIRHSEQKGYGGRTLPKAVQTELAAKLKNRAKFEQILKDTKMSKGERAAALARFDYVKAFVDKGEIPSMVATKGDW